MKTIKRKSEFDDYVAGMLKRDKGFSADYFEAFAEKPLTTQISILRRHLHLTQQFLAKRIKKPQSRIAEIEREKANPKLKILEKAAGALGCHIVIVLDSKLRRVAQVVAA